MILTRHLDAYQNILDPVLTTQQIPYFKDIQKSMADHPLVELLSSLFDIYDPNRARNYRYDDVMRFLKSELVLPMIDGKPMSIDAYRQALALTDNLVLKNAYADSRWTQKKIGNMSGFRITMKDRQQLRLPIRIVTFPDKLTLSVIW